MIFHKNYVRATKAESLRISRMLALGCRACVIEYALDASLSWPCELPECHHIVEGGKRLGHSFTIGLCPGHHRGVFSSRQRDWIAGHQPVPSIGIGKKPFVQRYGTERQLWSGTQSLLDLPAEWPASKILPRVAI